MAGMEKQLQVVVGSLFQHTLPQQARPPGSYPYHQRCRTEYRSPRLLMLTRAAVSLVGNLHCFAMSHEFLAAL
jgi:hypothetical protein